LNVRVKRKKPEKSQERKNKNKKRKRKSLSPHFIPSSKSPTIGEQTMLK